MIDIEKIKNPSSYYDPLEKPDMLDFPMNYYSDPTLPSTPFNPVTPHLMYPESSRATTPRVETPGNIHAGFSPY